MQSPNIKYLPAVDHLRGVAALWIVSYHGQQLVGAKLAAGRLFVPTDWIYSANPLAALLYEGHTAVALFMTLSGFIFTYGAFGSAIDYRAFITNRLLRIYPLFVVVLLAGVAIFPTRFDLGRLVSSLFLFANVANLDVGPLSAMFWAVSVEFQFYLLFPALLAFVARRPWRHAAQIVALALVLRTIGVLLGANARDMSYFHLLGRIDQFVAGMMAAIVLRRREGAPVPVVAAVGAGLAAVAAIYGFHRLGGWPVEGSWKILWPLVEGAAWAAVIATYVGALDPWPRAVSRALAAIGQISYSVYLFHFAIVLIVVERGLAWTPFGRAGRDALLTTWGLIIPVTAALAALSYHTVELPFLALRRSYLRR